MSDDEMAKMRERVARIEESQENQDRRLGIIQDDIRAIRSVLDQMSGGKKTVLLIFALIGAVAAAAGVYAAVSKVQ